MSRPQRILMTADAVGGVWRYAIDLGRGLAAADIHTTLAVMGPPPTRDQRAEADAAGLDIADRPYRLEWMDDPWDDVERAGAWLLELERQLRPALVHLNGYAHAVLPWRSPVVVVAHSCVRSWWRAVRRETPPPHVNRYTAAVSAGLGAAHIVVAPTVAMAAALKAEYGAPLTVCTIPNGHRSTRSASGPGQPAVEKTDIVFAAGRVWDEGKNIAALCDVAASLRWPVYVAGEMQSPDGTRCGPPGAHLLGRLSPGDLAGWFRQVSIYALPARYEPFGLSILEAAAAGCALVLGNIPSLRENWGGAAIFVSPDDRAGLAGALNRLIDRPDERADLGRRAVERASAFTIDRTVDRYVQLYQALTT